MTSQESSSSPSPVRQKDRAVGLDVLRGLAIFGILVVNVQQMFIPFSLANSPVPMIPGERGTWFAWAATDALFVNKFLTLFSLLFGAGFCLQWTRTRESARTFRRLYLRRIFVLILFGVVHALFFYMADVLVIYGLTALGLFAVKRLGGKPMLVAGSVLLTAVVAWYGYAWAGPGAKAAEKPEKQRAVVEEIDRMRREGTIRLGTREFGPMKRLDVTDEVPDDDPALSGGAQVFDDGRIQLADSEYALPMPKWLAILIFNDGGEEDKAKVEYAVYSRGPIRAAVFGRFMMLLAFLVLYTPFYLGWRTLALFMIGAACVKLGLLEVDRRSLWRRVTAIGVGLGLPLSLAATLLRGMAYNSPGNLTTLGNLLQEVSSLVLATGIAAVVFLWCSGALRGVLQRSLASVGRTALTNYIGQSVVMSLVATSYGLGLYGDLTRLRILGLAVVCFSLQMLVSGAWLRHFRMGPLEWVWRCLTYWRWQPLRVRQSPDVIFSPVS